MPTSNSTTGSRFAVDLGDLKLPPIGEKQIAAEIQAIVLRKIAEMDTGGRSRMAKFKDQFPDGTMGFWNPPDGGPPHFPFPWGTPSQPQREALTPEDHTTVMRAIMDHPFEVLHYMDKKDRTSNASPVAVLEAARQVENIGPHAKTLIERILEILKALEGARSRAPEDYQRSLDDLRGRLTGLPIDDQISTLRSLRSSYRGQDGIAEGMEVAARMLEDGKSSIYSPDHPFYRMLQEGRTRAARKPIDDIKNADTLGAVAGGGVGVFVGGVGAGPGAAAGGAGASAGAAIVHLINWLL
jgi:hypothetical protein